MNIATGRRSRDNKEGQMSKGVLAEVLAGQVLKLSDVAKRFPGRTEGVVNPATVHRWATHGITVNGQRVKLETCRVGRRLLTSEPALERFLSALQGEPAEATEASATPGRRRAAELAETERELSEMGL